MGQVTERLAVEEDDPDTARAIKWLADQGIIETAHQTEQRGPSAFRLTY